MKKEMEERNKYLELFNVNEPVIERCIKKYNIGLKNPITFARKKTHELEEFFSKFGKEYYTGTVVGFILNSYLFIVLEETLRSLEPIMNFENSIRNRRFPYRLPFIKNPHLDAFEASLQKITGLTIDENFSQILGQILTKKAFIQALPVIAQELVELGYVDLAIVALPEAYRIIDEKESGSTSKANQKAIKH